MIRLAEQSHNQLTEMLAAYKEREPLKSHTMQSVLADILAKAHKKGVK